MMFENITEPKQQIKELILRRTLDNLESQKNSTLAELQVAANIIHLISH